MNDRLRWASTFHSLHAISTQFAPTCGSEGIEYVEASTFCMHCLKTPTGMSDFNSKHILFIILVSSPILCYLGLKFVCVGSKESKNLPEFLDQVYVCYCDYLMKVCFEWLFLFYLMISRIHSTSLRVLSTTKPSMIEFHWWHVLIKKSCWICFLMM